MNVGATSKNSIVGKDRCDGIVLVSDLATQSLSVKGDLPFPFPFPSPILVVIVLLLFVLILHLMTY